MTYVLVGLIARKSYLGGIELLVAIIVVTLIIALHRGRRRSLLLYLRLLPLSMDPK